MDAVCCLRSLCTWSLIYFKVVRQITLITLQNQHIWDICRHKYRYHLKIILAIFLHPSYKRNRPMEQIIFSNQVLILFSKLIPILDPYVKNVSSAWNKYTDFFWNMINFCKVIVKCLHLISNQFDLTIYLRPNVSMCILKINTDHIKSWYLKMT